MSNERANLTSTVVGRVLGIGSFALSTLLIGVTLGIDAAGAVLFVQAMCGTLAVLVAYGEERYVTLLFARSDDERWRSTIAFWLGTRPWRRISVGGAATFVIVVLWLQVPTPLADVETWVAVTLAVSISVMLGIQRILAEALRAGGQAVHANLGTGRAGGVVTQCIFVLLLSASLLIEGREMLSLERGLLMLSFASLVGLGHVLIVFAWVGRSLSGSVDRDTLAAIEHSPTQTLLASGSGVLFSQMDMLIAGSILGPTPLGIYGLARRIGVIINTPGYVANLFVVRRIAGSTGDEQAAELSRFLPVVSAVASAASVVGSVGLVLAPSGFYRLLVPSGEVQQARYVLAALALGQVLNVASGSCGTVLLLFGRQRAMLIAAIGGIACIGITALVVSRSGSAFALALGTTAATAIYFGYLAYVSRTAAGITTDALGVMRRNPITR